MAARVGTDNSTVIITENGSRRSETPTRRRRREAAVVGAAQSTGGYTRQEKRFLVARISRAILLHDPIAILVSLSLSLSLSLSHRGVAAAAKDRASRLFASGILSISTFAFDVLLFLIYPVFFLFQSPFHLVSVRFTSCLFNSQ